MAISIKSNSFLVDGMKKGITAKDMLFVSSIIATRIALTVLMGSNPSFISDIAIGVKWGVFISANVSLILIGGGKVKQMVKDVKRETNRLKEEEITKKFLLATIRYVQKVQTKKRDEEERLLQMQKTNLRSVERRHSMPVNLQCFTPEISDTESIESETDFYNFDNTLEDWLSPIFSK